MQLLIHPITLQLKHTFRIAHGSRDHHDSVVVELRQNAEQGWGEASCSTYFEVNQEDLIAQLKAVKPHLERYELSDLIHFNAMLRQWLPHAPFVRSALDIAAHDLLARIKGLTTREMLGLSSLPTPLSCFTIGMGAADEMAQRIVETPWPLYKLKMGGANDLHTLQHLRTYTDAPFQLDANGAWNIDLAKEVCDRADELNVVLLEQPLPAYDWAGHRQLRDFAQIPIVADESCMDLGDIPACSKSFDGINIKLPKCGGMSEARQMIQKARAMDLQVMMGCMTESSVGISGIAQLAPLLDHIDLDGAMLLANDPFIGVTIDMGNIIFPEVPGNAVRKRSV